MIITAAAIIMVAAFSGFVAGRVAALQEFGFGLAAAIFVDATIIRAILVPSLMALFGRYNWWLPAPLARVGADEALAARARALPAPTPTEARRRATSRPRAVRSASATISSAPAEAPPIRSTASQRARSSRAIGWKTSSKAASPTRVEPAAAASGRASASPVTGRWPAPEERERRLVHRAHVRGDERRVVPGPGAVGPGDEDHQRRDAHDCEPYGARCSQRR